MSGASRQSNTKVCVDVKKKSRLLHEALSKATAARTNKKVQVIEPYEAAVECLDGVASSSCTTKLSDVERIKGHPLMPVLELLCKKCGDATHTMQPKAFQMNDVCQVRYYYALQ